MASGVGLGLLIYHDRTSLSFPTYGGMYVGTGPITKYEVLPHAKSIRASVLLLVLTSFLASFVPSPHDIGVLARRSWAFNC